MRQQHEYVMLLGGPAHGEVVKFDLRQDVLLWPEPMEPIYCGDDPPGGFRRPRVHQYYWKRLATPDHWVQVCYVHSELLGSGLALASISEAQMIAAIMEPWRAAWRAGEPQACGGELHLTP